MNLTFSNLVYLVCLIVLSENTAKLQNNLTGKPRTLKVYFYIVYKIYLWSVTYADIASER